MAGPANTEGEGTTSNKLAGLKEVGKRIKARLLNSHPASVEPKAPPSNAEMISVPAGSGFANLVEKFKGDAEIVGNDALGGNLEEEYIDLIETVQLDTRLDEETRKLLSEGVNGGNKEVIAVIVARLLERLKLDDKTIRMREHKKDPVLQNRISKVDFITRRMQRYFINEEVRRNEGNELDYVKQDLAQKDYYRALINPAWQPPEPLTQLPGYIGKAFANPQQPTVKSPPPQK